MTERLRPNMTRGLTTYGLLAAIVLSAPATARASGPPNRWDGVAQQPPAAPPTSVVNAEVTLIHATADADGGIDARIGKLPQLGNYQSYRLLSRQNMAIKRASPTTTTLPNGRILQISLKDVKDGRYVIDTSINQPGGTTFLPLLEVRAAVDVPVFIAGQTYQGGMLVISIKILR